MFFSIAHGNFMAFIDSLKFSPRSADDVNLNFTANRYRKSNTFGRGQLQSPQLSRWEHRAKYFEIDRAGTTTLFRGHHTGKTQFSSRINLLPFTFSNFNFSHIGAYRKFQKMLAKKVGCIRSTMSKEVGETSETIAIQLFPLSSSGGWLLIKLKFSHLPYMNL